MNKPIKRNFQTIRGLLTYAYRRTFSITDTQWNQQYIVTPYRPEVVEFLKELYRNQV